MIVQSSFGEYRVRFVEDPTPALNEVVRPGDVLIADRVVVDGHRDAFSSVLESNRVVEITANEAQKSYAGLESVFEELIENGFRRGNRLVSVGGGITQDVTAFIASVLYRGVDWIFLPTTLLAQADSCIGSKTSINFGRYKNQLGGFYPPTEIVIATDFLRTLPREHWLSGLGEMAHYFPIDGEAAFGRFKTGVRTVLADGSGIEELTAESLRIKKGYVERDEFDRGPRQIFNYGHSFGHAIESVTEYAVPHGIAVSYGIDMANLVSCELGLLDSSVREEIREGLVPIWSEFALPKIDRDAFGAALRRDKKNRGDELGLILTRGWGDMFKHFCAFDARIEGCIDDFFTSHDA